MGCFVDRPNRLAKGRVALALIQKLEDPTQAADRLYGLLKLADDISPREWPYDREYHQIVGPFLIEGVDAMLTIVDRMTDKQQAIYSLQAALPYAHKGSSIELYESVADRILDRIAEFDRKDIILPMATIIMRALDEDNPISIKTAAQLMQATDTIEAHKIALRGNPFEAGAARVFFSDMVQYAPAVSEIWGVAAIEILVDIEKGLGDGVGEGDKALVELIARKASEESSIKAKADKMVRLPPRPAAPQLSLRGSLDRMLRGKYRNG